MESLGDVGDALQRVLDKIDQAIAAHHRAADLAEQARELLAVAGSGTLQADVERACALFTRVIEGISEPEGQASTLATVADMIRSYLRRHEISHEKSGAAPTAAVASVPAAVTPTPEPAPGSSEHVEALRRQLPPAVQPGSGAKTHGLWFVRGQAAGGEIASGDGHAADEVWRLLRDAGLPRPGRPFTASHAEMKLAAHMRTNGIRSAEIVINNVPCKLDFGCETLLGVILPEGYSLTVHGTNGYRKTFTGGKKPPWRR